MSVKRITIIILILILTVSAIVFFLGGTTGEEPSVPITGGVNNFPLGVVAENLAVPWDVAFLPEGGLLITERPGNLVHIRADGERQSIPVPKASQRGEGGLLGITLHPDFESNRTLYLYMTVSQGTSGLSNAVMSYRFEDDALLDERTVIENIPGASNHDGGRIEFGPDGHLYITTGDAGSGVNAQNLNSLAGKILRLRGDGSIPDNNLFVDRAGARGEIWSYGHRNPQGLAWDDEGRLWETEHGRSGIQSGLDEVNLIVAAGNYGWPDIEGDASRTGMTIPAAHSGASRTWAPASAVFWDGSLFFGGLRGEALYEAVLLGDRVSEVREHLKGEYGRIRTVRLGPDGYFYITTSNTDGRGSTRAGDDKLIRLDPRNFR